MKHDLNGIVPDNTPEVPKLPGKTVQRWADNAMFSSPELTQEGGPKVYLLSMTPDPLGTIAAVNQMYTGGVVKALSQVTDEERHEHWRQVTKTRLKAPFEFVKFHFLLEGVTRAFTHQLVRQRTATYAQESLRFAVVEDNFVDRVALPPSLSGTTGEQAKIRERWKKAEEGMSDVQYLNELDMLSDAEKQRGQWDRALGETQQVYTDLVESGMPAEDARGLLPTNILTRVHYTTDLRNLLDIAGNRLCTQAQFEWRLVWAQMIKAIREYMPILRISVSDSDPYRGINNGPMGDQDGYEYEASVSDRWQYEEIAGLFKPICYQTGKCEWLSASDRTCSIRNRVQANHDIGRPSEGWNQEYDEIEGNPILPGVGPHSVVREEEGGRPVFIGAISPVEWLGDATAARKNGGGHLASQ